MFRSNTVEIYDSIQQDRRYVWSQIFQLFVARHMNKRGRIKRKWEPAVPRHILRGFAPTQRDGFNCGFYVIEMAKRILWHKCPRDSKYHVPMEGADEWGRPLPEYAKKIMRKRKKWRGQLYNQLCAQG
jgi:hypothetical protein